LDLLNLKKEPFSISPDPNFFYRSKDYEECLQKLELSIRLRRGLNIVLGDVGTGKTTLSRALIQLFQGYEEFRFHLILDPSFNSEYEFLLALVKIFQISIPHENTCLAFKEAIRTYLLKEGLEKKRIIVLIIDETQKMDYPFLELLRDFLNFETNEYKLLQLVILGQMEFLEKIQGKKNFMDRINLLYFLKPLSLEDTREMIEFRLKKAGYFFHQPLFGKDAFRRIYYYSQGYPRRIVSLCHHALLLMLIKKKRILDRQLIDLVAESLFPERAFPMQRLRRMKAQRWKIAGGGLAAIVLIILTFGFLKTRHHAQRPATETGQDHLPLSGNSQPAVTPPQSATPPLSATSPLSAIPSQNSFSTSPGLVPPGNEERDLADERTASFDSGLSPYSGIPAFLQNRQLTLEPPMLALPEEMKVLPVPEEIKSTPGDGLEEKNKEGNDFPPPPAPISKVDEDSSHTTTGPQPGELTTSSNFGPQAREDIRGYWMIKAEKGDSISSIASKLYGADINDKALSLIKEANPHILNLDLIEPGQNIYFPILDDTLDGKSGFHVYGVQVGSFETMSQAQACIQQVSHLEHRIYIERETSPDRKGRYSITVGPFVKMDEAWDFLEIMKGKKFKNSRVIVIH
ncbi:MAG: AAA family ATPase, partial [bacterium]